MSKNVDSVQRKQPVCECGHGASEAHANPGTAYSLLFVYAVAVGEQAPLAASGGGLGKNAWGKE